jgi:hypothetical protein
MSKHRKHTVAQPVKLVASVAVLALSVAGGITLGLELTSWTNTSGATAPSVAKAPSSAHAPATVTTPTTSATVPASGTGGSTTASPAITGSAPSSPLKPARSTSTGAPVVQQANASLPGSSHSLANSQAGSTSTGGAGTNSPVANPPGESYPAPTAITCIPPAGWPVGVYYICSGTPQQAPVIPAAGGCSGTATQCLNNLSGDPEPVPEPGLNPNNQ